MQKDTESLRVYIGLFADKHYKATNRLASQDFELPTKVNFLGKLTNVRIRNKVTQSKEFKDFDKFSLQDCFRAALEQEGIGMVSEAVNMTATATPKIMAIYQEQHETECCHQHQVNEVSNADDNGRARNNNCWKCGDTGHFARECPQNTPESNQPKLNPVAANAEINIPWTLPIRQNLMTDMMKRAINSEVGRRTAQAKYKRLKNKVQQITTASSTPATTKQKALKATTSANIHTTSVRPATTTSKTNTKNTKATTLAPSMPKMEVKTEPVTTTTTENSKATTSYTGPITRAKAKKQAQVQLLETIPENLLSESDDDEYSLLEDLQTALADDDSEDDDVDNELPHSDEEIEEK